MALREQRVFRDGRDFWVAHVGASWGSGDGDRPPSASDEVVFFTCITDRSKQSRSATIAVERLRRMSHRELVETLDSAASILRRIEFVYDDLPSAEVFDRTDLVTDAEGLRWSIDRIDMLRIESGKPVPKRGIRVLCLDDSAMVRDVMLESMDTLDNAQDQYGGEILRKIVESIKSLYKS